VGTSSADRSVSFDGVNYTTYKELRVNGYGVDSTGVVRGGTGDNRFAGRIILTEDEIFAGGTAFTVDAGGTLTLSGTIEFTSGGGTALEKRGSGRLKFQDITFIDSGTASVFQNSGSEIEFAITSGVTRSLDGPVGSASTLGTVGRLVKSGAGTFSATEFGAATLEVMGGTLKLAQEGTTVFGGSGDANQIRTGALTMATTSGVNPTATLDISNNEMVIDYTGTSPLAGTLSTGVGRWIAYANAGGSWTNPGITSSFANSGTFAVGYGEATEALGLGSGTTTWEGQTVDTTSILIKLTYYGDANLDGVTDETDASMAMENWKDSALWTGGDFNYDYFVDESDYELLQNNMDLTPVGRGTLPAMARLYLLTLEYPEVYWDIRSIPSIWDDFAPYEAMNLGTIPPMPQARGVPEPGCFVSLWIAFGCMLRRRGQN
jgi:hypothetical protein